MQLILAYTLMVLLGGIALWIIAKLFSADTPSFVLCFMGAGVAELISLLHIPIVPFLVLFFFLVKFAGFEGWPAFFGTLLYAVLKIVLFVMIVATVAKIF